MSDTPIYDQLRREKQVEAWRKAGLTMAQAAANIQELFAAFGKGVQDGQARRRERAADAADS